MIGHGIVGVTVPYLGWASSFYFSALLGCLVWLSWVIVVTDRPDLSSRISEKEKIYVETAIGSLVNKEQVINSKSQSYVCFTIISVCSRFRRRFPIGPFSRVDECGL